MQNASNSLLDGRSTDHKQLFTGDGSASWQWRKQQIKGSKGGASTLTRSVIPVFSWLRRLDSSRSTRISFSSSRVLQQLVVECVRSRRFAQLHQPGRTARKMARAKNAHHPPPPPAAPCLQGCLQVLCRGAYLRWMSSADMVRNSSGSSSFGCSSPNISASIAAAMAAAPQGSSQIVREWSGRRQQHRKASKDVPIRPVALWGQCQALLAGGVVGRAISSNQAMGKRRNATAELAALPAALSTPLSAVVCLIACCRFRALAARLQLASHAASWQLQLAAAPQALRERATGRHGLPERLRLAAAGREPHALRAAAQLRCCRPPPAAPLTACCLPPAAE